MTALRLECSMKKETSSGIGFGATAHIKPGWRLALVAMPTLSCGVRHAGRPIQSLRADFSRPSTDGQRHFASTCFKPSRGISSLMEFCRPGLQASTNGRLSEGAATAYRCEVKGASKRCRQQASGRLWHRILVRRPFSIACSSLHLVQGKPRFRTGKLANRLSFFCGRHSRR